MAPTEFVKAYDPDVSYQETSGGAMPEVVQARQWSHWLGRMLYQRLADPLSADQPENRDGLIRYIGWAQQNLDSIEAALVAKLPSDEALQLNNELNFHRLSLSMGGMWLLTAVHENQNYVPQRQQLLRIGQVSLALRGMQFYRMRERYASEQSSFSYFDQSVTAVRHSLEGAVTEFDAGIVLLAIIRHHPELIVVPAPPQFERGLERRYNADFIAFHRDGRAIGIQIKSTVSDEDFAAYDSERIELVDGRIDLGNTLVKRTTRKRYDPHPVTWAGLICAQYLHQVPTSGPGAGVLSDCGLQPKDVLLTKLQAREMTRDIRPNLVLAQQKIGPRILRHLVDQDGADSRTA